MNLHRKKVRRGYFLITFSLIILMVSVPLWVSMLKNDMHIRSEITRWNDWQESTVFGEGLLKHVTKKLSKNGLGYYNLGASYEMDGYTLNYDFVGASVVPTPTNYDAGNALSTSGGLIITGIRCSDSNAYGAYDCASGKPSVNGKTYTNLIYTSPALGTGNAAFNDNDCEVLGVRGNIKYSGTDVVMDPLDDPCNWNDISRGQQIAIPLFTINPENPTEYWIDIPSKLYLRVRTKCQNLSDEFCPPSKRYDFDVSEYQWLEPADVIKENIYDPSPRVLEWALNTSELYVPDMLRFAGPGGVEEFGRITNVEKSNTEITMRRLEGLVAPLSGYTRYDNDTGYFYVNGINNFALTALNNILIKNIQDARDHYDFSETLVGHLKKCNVLMGVNEYDEADCRIDTVNNRIVAHSSDNFNPPYLVIRMINNFFKEIPADGIHYYGIPTLEYQLLSDKPLGNTQFNAKGYITNPEGSAYNVDKQHLKANIDANLSTGTVFTN